MFPDIFMTESVFICLHNGGGGAGEKVKMELHVGKRQLFHDFDALIFILSNGTRSQEKNCCMPPPPPPPPPCLLVVAAFIRMSGIGATVGEPFWFTIAHGDIGLYIIRILQQDDGRGGGGGGGGHNNRLKH